MQTKEIESVTKFITMSRIYYELIIPLGTPDREEEIVKLIKLDIQNIDNYTQIQGEINKIKVKIRLLEELENSNE